MEQGSGKNDFRRALLMFEKDKALVEIGGVRFDPSADIVIACVGDDYLIAHQSLGGKEWDFVIPFWAITFVVAKP